MKTLVRITFYFACALTLVLSTPRLYATESVVRFGVTAHQNTDEAELYYRSLHQFLSAQMLPDHVELVFIEPASLDLADISAKTDFLLTDPYHYLQLKHQGLSRPPVLSQVSLTELGQQELAGGVIFCLFSNPLCNLEQIKNARITAAGPHSLLGYIAQLTELHQLGIELSAEQVQHVMSDTEIVTAVTQHHTDIGFVRTGVLEKHIATGAVAADAIKVLNPQQLAEMPVQTSTRLYPDWPVLVVSDIAETQVNRMMAALLSWQTTSVEPGHQQAFSSAADYQSVEHSLKILGLAPYQHSGQFSYLHSWSDHRGLVLFVVAQALVLLLLLLIFKRKNTQQHVNNTQLQHQNQQLKQYSKYLDTVLNNSAHLLLLRLDSQGQILHFNENALKLLQVSDEDLYGQSLINWLPEQEQHSALTKAMESASQAPEQATALALRMLLGSGKELYLDADLFYLPNAATAEHHYMLLGIDVSRRHWIEKRLKKSFKRLDELIERSPAVICAFDPTTMRLNYISPNCFTMYLKSSIEMMRMQNWWELFVKPDNKMHLKQKLQDWAEADYPGVLKFSSILNRHALPANPHLEEPVLSYQQLCIESQFCALRDEHGKVTEVIGSQLDISERHQAQMKQELAANVFTQAREGIFITDASGTILDLNRSFCRITGYSEQEALGRHFAMLSASGSDKLYFQQLWDELIKVGYWEGEISGKRKNGEYVVLSLTISVVQGAEQEAVHYVALFSDITQQKAQEDQLRFIAHFDSLTGLPNRLLLKDRIEQNMALAKRKQQWMAVIFIDIDGFKAVNDGLGHEAGDQLLIELANRMRAVMRENDTLARLGGDEFIALLTELPSQAECIPLIERLMKCASTPFHLQNQQAVVSASIGITFYPQDQAVDDATLIRQADLAMYQAKHSGKNQYAIYQG